MIRRFINLLPLVALLLAGPVLAASGNAGLEFLAKVEAAAAAGEISQETALLYKFYYGFAPEKLPKDFRPGEFAPLKNGTQIVWDYQNQRDRLSPETVAEIDRFLAPREGAKEVTSIYISPGGNFRFTYFTSGGNAVPSSDVNPANGIPDFVDRCASYMDYSWDLQVTQMGFGQPPLNPYYEVSFEAMAYYGYTVVVGGATTRIVLHNTFLGFPPNDDPEGNQWGAAKVTCAHEFKHATQRAQSYWSEGGWVELDATWMEDIAYDQVNDYYNYLPGQSPIRFPATSLDAGGSGSYEDCVWQHWMSETWTNQIIIDLWNWRRTHMSQLMMDSYQQMLSDYGVNLADGWADFTAWNYAVNYRALPGIGYGEAADFNTIGNPVATFTTYPASRTGSVAHLAANFIRCMSIGGQPGTVDVEFDGANGSAMRLTAIIKKTDGTGLIEPVPLDANNDANTSLSVALEQIAEVGFTMSNGTKTGGSLAWSLTVSQGVDLPDPELYLNVTSVDNTMEPDATDTETMEITNTGEPGSVLNYTISIQATAPRAPTGEKSIAGSSVSCNTINYVPGSTVDLVFTVYNGSQDDEWLTDVTLDFPAGVTVNSATHFVGGTYGDMRYDGVTGDGAFISWHGDTGPPDYYGVIIGGESAVATINLTFDSGLSGLQQVLWTITGDQWGGDPHYLAGAMVFFPAGPSLALTAPNGGELLAIGDPLLVTWTSSGTLPDVKIDFSRDAGSSWIPVTASTPNDGSYSDWVITGPASTDCLVRVSSLDDSLSDPSNGVFTIFQPVTWLTVLPDAGSLNQGETDLIALNFDTAGLTPDTYYAFLVIEHDAPGSPDVVPVTLTVSEPTGVGGIPVAFRLDGNHPNPFNPQTAIAFSLAQAGPAVVDVLDLRGRLVRTVWRGELAAGPHQVAWDGRDGQGREVAAGTYLARLRSGSHIATAKMVLAK